MSDLKDPLREFGSNFRAVLEGLLGERSGAEKGQEILSAARDPRNIRFGPEIRRARLFTEITVGGKTFDIEAAGARSCSTKNLSFSRERTTNVFGLTCDLTFFAADNTPLGPVRIIQDPRIETKGWIILRRNEKGEFELPGLSFFNQHLIFHVGDKFFYYPRAWQVVSAITAWPPEFHQYHHLEDDTPIFDFLTKQPNVARKGVSTISIEGPLTADEERQIREEHAREIETVKALPASKMKPEDLTPGQVIPEEVKKKG